MKMKTLSLLFCLLLVIFGFVGMLKNDLAGIVLMIVGGFAFLIIIKKTEKIPGYNPKSFMNR